MLFKFAKRQRMDNNREGTLDLQQLNLHVTLTTFSLYCPWLLSELSLMEGRGSMRRFETIYLLAPPAVLIFSYSFLTFCLELKQKHCCFCPIILWLIITPINTQMLMVFYVLIVTNAWTIWRVTRRTLFFCLFVSEDRLFSFFCASMLFAYE